ncbi:TPA: DUF1472 domain-containing protein, partial [Escherichia coli]|nr:DUF1472 domain-containing protein [Escherichia coli]
RDFPVVHPLRFRGLTLQLPPAVCVRLRLPLRPVHPRLIARLLWRHGTARCRGICEQRRKTSCSMRNLSLCTLKSVTVSPFCLTCLATIFCMPRRMCTRWRKK